MSKGKLKVFFEELCQMFVRLFPKKNTSFYIFQSKFWNKSIVKFEFFKWEMVSKELEIFRNAEKGER